MANNNSVDYVKFLSSNGKIYPMDTNNVIDITEVYDEDKLSNLCPGFYKIKLHENFGSHELVVLVTAVYGIYNEYTNKNQDIHIIIWDNETDGTEALYWNGGWKIDSLLFDSTEEWVDACDWSDK